LTQKQQSAHLLRESESLDITKSHGKSAIRLLIELDLLNRGLAPTSNEILHLPLSRPPDSKEREFLSTTLGTHTVSIRRFPLRSKSVASLEKALESRLPSSIVPLVSKSFDIVGDIAVIELSPAAKPFERKIAESLMSVHKNITSVYSKAGPISDSRRLRPLQHILGNRKTQTIHKEHGCLYKIDISKVFFSPRLSAEHDRVANLVHPNECVLDMFSGIGPFAILIAKRCANVQVHAIDSNPDAAELVGENARMNRVNTRVRVWCGDAESVIDKNLRRTADRIIMNHPSEAKRFIEPACMALSPKGGTIHYYTFKDGRECEAKASEEFVEALDHTSWKIAEPITTRKVRGVAPMKWQIGVDSRLVPA